MTAEPTAPCSPCPPGTVSKPRIPARGLKRDGVHGTQTVGVTVGIKATNPRSGTETRVNRNFKARKSHLEHLVSKPRIPARGLKRSWISGRLSRGAESVSKPRIPARGLKHKWCCHRADRSKEGQYCYGIKATNPRSGTETVLRFVMVVVLTPVRIKATNPRSGTETEFPLPFPCAP